MILILKEPLRVNPGQATWLQWTQEGASILSVGPRGTAHPKPEMTLCPTLPIPGFPHPHQTNKKPYQVQHPLLPRAVPLASLTSQSITVCSVWSLLSVTASFALFSSHWSFYIYDNFICQLYYLSKAGKSKILFLVCELLHRFCLYLKYAPVGCCGSL